MQSPMMPPAAAKMSFGLRAKALIEYQ